MIRQFEAASWRRFEFWSSAVLAVVCSIVGGFAFGNPFVSIFLASFYGVAWFLYGVYVGVWKLIVMQDGSIEDDGRLASRGFCMSALARR